MPQEGGAPFAMAGQSEQVRLVTFKVPASAAAGSHEIVYSARDSATPSIIDEKTLTVIVHPVVKLELFIDEKPENVIAGEPCLVKMRIANRGNAEAKVALAVKNSPAFPFKLEPKELTLGAGKSGFCTVQVNVDKDYAQAVTLVVGVEAETVDAKGSTVTVDKPAIISIIPRTTGHFDPYHRIPCVAQVWRHWPIRARTGSGGFCRGPEPSMKIKRKTWTSSSALPACSASAASATGTNTGSTTATPVSMPG